MTTEPRTVLVIDNNRKQLAWIARIVRTVVSDAEASGELTDQSALDTRELVVVNYDNLSDDGRAKLLSTTAADDSPCIVLVSSKTQDYEQLVAALVEHRLSNLVAINGAPHSADLAITLRKILSRDIFGLSKYFGWGVDTQTTTVQSSVDAARFIDQTTHYARMLDVHPRLIDQVATVAEELVSNALYNAPVDASGVHKFAHLPRTSQVTLEPDQEIATSVACDGRWFGVSVSDPFGSLTRDQCLEHLVKGLRRDEREPHDTKGGAGLGLYMTFDSLNQMTVNIAPGVRTEVVGLIDVSGSYRDFANRGKSFNIFLEPRDE